MQRIIICINILLFACTTAFGQSFFDTTIHPADEAYAQYVPLLKDKRVGLIINHTSKVGDSSLLDILLARGVNITKIYVPEHGFRGGADAGAHIDNEVDKTTGIPIISLYGAHKKPTAADLAQVDLLIYDLQDVGVRFYTYISTLEYCMEAAAEQQLGFIVLDRPNPNGFYVDGPVLDTHHRSFVGMQPIPVVYGMTAGEYANYLVGQEAIKKASELSLQVIKCRNYTHKKLYALPIAPSPNLKQMAAVYAYPSMCLFEGTHISVGRGTAQPFLCFGCPNYTGAFMDTFRPVSRPGAVKPLFMNQLCYGRVLDTNAMAMQRFVAQKGFDLQHLMDAYQAYPQKDSFFQPFLTKLVGNTQLAIDIRNKRSVKTIKASWQKDIKTFMRIRRKYLLYPDF